MTAANICKRLLIVGDSACGKTCIFNQFLQKRITDKQPHRANHHTLKVEFNRQHVVLDIWDTDDSNYQSLDPECYSDTDVIIMCLSVDQPASLANIAKKWSPEMKRLCPEVPIVLVGNKTDRRGDELTKLEKMSKLMEQVKTEYGLAMAETIGAYAYRECSAMFNEGIMQVFETALIASMRLKKKETKKELGRTPQIEKLDTAYKRIVIVGDRSCGKTCMLIQYLQKQFMEKSLPKWANNHIHNLLYNRQLVVLDIMDTNETTYSCLKQEYYFDVHVIIMCFSVDRADSLANIADKWIPQMKLLSSKVPILLVGNKMDLRGKGKKKWKRDRLCENIEIVKPEEGQAMAKQIGAHLYLECSAKLNVGVEEVFDAVIRTPLPNLKGKNEVESRTYPMRSMSETTKKVVAIVGDKACGKTSMLVHFFQKQVFDKQKPDLADHHTFKMEVDQHPVLLEVWDTNDSNHDHLQYYLDADVVLMCFSINSPVSLASIQKKWSPEIKSLVPDVKIVLVGNKVDLRDNKKKKRNDMEIIESEFGERLAVKIRAYAYCECSAKENQGVKELFRTVLKVACRKEKKNKKAE